MAKGLPAGTGQVVVNSQVVQVVDMPDGTGLLDVVAETLKQLKESRASAQGGGEYRFFAINRELRDQLLRWVTKAAEEG